MRPADVFCAALMKEIHSLLKPMGFRKKGSTLGLALADRILWVNLQRSMFSRRDAAQVTVNLGVTFPLLDEILRRERRLNWMTAHWRKRIGRYTPSGEDTWWSLESEESLAQAVEDILPLLQLATREMQALPLTEERVIAARRQVTDLMVDLPLEDFMAQKAPEAARSSGWRPPVE